MKDLRCECQSINYILSPGKFFIISKYYNFFIYKVCFQNFFCKGSLSNEKWVILNLDLAEPVNKTFTAKICFWIHTHSNFFVREKEHFLQKKNYLILNNYISCDFSCRIWLEEINIYCLYTFFFFWNFFGQKSVNFTSFPHSEKKKSEWNIFFYYLYFK